MYKRCVCVESGGRRIDDRMARIDRCAHVAEWERMMSET